MGMRAKTPDRACTPPARHTPNLPRNTTLLNLSNRPKIVRKVVIEEIGIRHGEVAFYPPSFSPRVPHNKPLLGVYISHCEHGMPADLLFLRFGHWNLTRLCHLLAFKALVDAEPKYKRVAGCQASLHLLKGSGHPLVLNGFMLSRRDIAIIRRFVTELPYIIDPHVLRAGPLMVYALYSVSYIGAGIGVYRSLHSALIVIDKQPRRSKDLGQTLLHLIELNGGGNRICRAASQLALVINWRAMRAQVNLRREFPHDCNRG